MDTKNDGAGTGTGASADGNSGSTGSTGSSGAGGQQSGGDAGSNGYPADTPIAEMTPAEQAAYWKAQSRKHESRVKALGTPEEIRAWKDASAELDKLRKANMGDQERAVAEAREQAAADTARKFAGQLVAAEFRAATAGRVQAEELTDVLDSLDLTKFLTEDGSVNVEKVNQLAARITGEGDGGARRGAPAAFPYIGQGRRPTSSPNGLAAGQAAFEARKGRSGGMPSF